MAVQKLITSQSVPMTFTIGFIHHRNVLTFQNDYHVSSFYGAIQFLRSILDSESVSQSWSCCSVPRLFQWEKLLCS